MSSLAAILQALDVFMAGDDVPKKKPDPIIYVTAAQRMGLDPTHCMCVEDSTTGLKVSLREERPLHLESGALYLQQLSGV